MLKIYAQEFVNVCGFIAEKLPNQVCDNYYYIQPAQLRAMLDKNLFDESDVKLHIWRNLGWLLCDPERFTKKITHKGRQLRVCVLNYIACEQLRELLGKGSGKGKA